MHETIEHERLSVIEGELTRGGWHERFQDGALEARYGAERHDQSRLYNRIAVVLLIGLLDCYCFSEFRQAPEIVVPSALMRFGLITPLAAGLVLLDWRGSLGRWSGACVAMLPVLSSAAAAVELHLVRSSSGLPFAYGAPLIVLSAQCFRLSLQQATVAIAVSAAVNLAALSAASVVPAGQVPMLVVNDLSMATITLLMCARLDLRDRRAFLLDRQAGIARDMLARQNQKLTRLTYLDALTGLANRRCFDEPWRHSSAPVQDACAWYRW